MSWFYSVFASGAPSGPVDEKDFSRDLRILLLLSTLVIAIFVTFISISPPHEGDSSEFASIARNILEHSGVREDLIKDFSRSDYSISHPATTRKVFFSYVALPFYLVFRESALTIAVPGGLFFLFTVLTTYLCGTWFFGRKTAFPAAIATLFSLPICFVYCFNEPFEPEMLQMPLYLLTLFLFVRKRFLFAGVLFALSFMTKQTSIVLGAAVFFYVILFAREKKFFTGAAVFFLAALVTVSPILIRNQLVFGNPMYSEQAFSIPRTYSDYYQLILDGRIQEIAYNYSLNKNAPETTVTRSETTGRFFTLAKHNAGILLFGNRRYQANNMGLIDALNFFLLLFAIYGAVRFKDVRERHLLSIVCILQCCFFLLWPLIYLRYLLPVFPIMYLLAFHGAGTLFHRRERIGMDLAYFLIIFDFAFFALFFSLSSLTDRQQNSFNQMRHMCEWVEANTDPDSVIIGFPYSSVNFLCDRKTVIYPYGDLEELRTVFDDFEADYLFYNVWWRGDRYPLYSGLTPVMRNQRSTLFRIDRSAINSSPDSYIAQLNSLDYFSELRMDIDIFPSFFRFTRKNIQGLFTNGSQSGQKPGEPSPAVVVFSWLAAIVIVAGLFAVFVFSGRSKPMRVSAFVLLTALSLLAGILKSLPVFQAFPNEKPAASAVQVFNFIEDYVESMENEGKPLSLAHNMHAGFLSQIIENSPDKERFGKIIEEAAVKADTSIEDLLTAGESEIAIYFEKPPEGIFNSINAVSANVDETIGYNEHIFKIEKQAQENGWMVTGINGGLIFWRPRSEM